MIQPPFIPMISGPGFSGFPYTKRRILMKTNMTPMQIVDAAYTACYAYNAECSHKLAGKIVSLFTHKSAAVH